MRRIAWFSVLVVALLQGFALADGAFFPTEQQWKQTRERSYINEPEQKAVVFFSKGTEQLIISPSYDGPSSSFAWVVPVPSRPEVEMLKGAIFHELAKLVEPKLPTGRPSKSVDATSAAPGAVTVLERKTVGAYDVSVLSATDGQALMKWLKANKYHLPEKALAPMKSYVKQGWTFVASRIKAPSSSKGLQAGTLAPIRLTFKAKQPVYPMKLSSANPDTFTALIYLVLPSADIVGKPKEIDMRGWRDQGSTRWAATASGYPWNRGNYPTLAKLYNGEMRVYVQRCYAHPEDCTQDMVWRLPGSRK